MHSNIKLAEGDKFSQQIDELYPDATFCIGNYFEEN